MIMLKKGWSWLHDKFILLVAFCVVVNSLVSPFVIYSFNKQYQNEVSANESMRSEIERINAINDEQRRGITYLQSGVEVCTEVLSDYKMYYYSPVKLQDKVKLLKESSEKSVDSSNKLKNLYNK